MLFEEMQYAPKLFLPQGMWQVLLSNLITWANVCPRSTSLAETLLLCAFCWFLGFLSGAAVVILLVSARCRHILWLLIGEFLGPPRTPATPSGESRLAGYRRP